MDSIDYAILAALQENGRATASSISQKINLSIPAVAERIRKLEAADVIQQYTIKINRRKIDKRLLVFILVNLAETGDIAGFRTAITAHRCVLECHHIAGSYDYLLKVVLEDTAALEEFLTGTLKKIPGVTSSNTIITLTTLKEELNF